MKTLPTLCALTTVLATLHVHAEKHPVSLPTPSSEFSLGHVFTPHGGHHGVGVDMAYNDLPLLRLKANAQSTLDMKLELELPEIAGQAAVRWTFAQGVVASYKEHETKIPTTEYLGAGLASRIFFTPEGSFATAGPALRYGQLQPTMHAFAYGEFLHSTTADGHPLVIPLVGASSMGGHELKQGPFFEAFYPSKELGASARIGYRIGTPVGHYVVGAQSHLALNGLVHGDGTSPFQIGLSVFMEPHSE